MLTNFSTATEGTRIATITYTENGITKTTTFTYTVTDTVTNINVNTQPTKATKYGENADLTGVTINVVKGSGTTTIPVTKRHDKTRNIQSNNIRKSTSNNPI